MNPLDPNLIGTNDTGFIRDALKAIDSKFKEPVQRQYKNLDIALHDTKTTYTTVSPNYGLDVMSITIDGFSYTVGTPVNIENLVELLTELDIGWFYVNDDGDLEVTGFHTYGDIVNDSSTVRFTAGTPVTQNNVPTITDIVREISLKITLGNSGFGWKLDGNALEEEKFIGTTNSYDLPIVVNNSEVARFFTTGEVGFNTDVVSGAIVNIVGTSNVNNVKTFRVGSSDGSTSFEIRNSGNFYRNGSFYSYGADPAANNTSWGTDALNKNVIGTRNSAFAVNVLKLATTGNKNTGGGYNALSKLTTGSSDTAWGVGSSQKIVDADFCTSTGEQSLNGNISGDSNTADGYKSLEVCVGPSHTATGAEASLLIDSGTGTTSHGALAGAYFNGSSSNTTSLGRQAGLRTSATAINNSTYVGSRTVSEGTNEAVLGGRNVDHIYLGVGKFAQGADLGDVHLSIHSPASGSAYYATETSNHNGVDIYLDMAQGLGTGNPGKWYIQHSTPTTSGTTLQTLKTTALWSYDDLVLNPYGTTSGNTFAIKLKELAANGVHTVAIKAPDSITASYNFVLPSGVGGANTFLRTDTSGNTSWVDINTFKDNLFFIQDNGDNTKQLQFQLSNIPTATTRTLTVYEDAKIVKREIFDHFTDVTVGGTETDIYSDTTIASRLGTNGDKITASYAGEFVTVGTELTQLQVYFAGTSIFDSTAVAPTTGTSFWRVRVEIIRVSGTKIRYTVTLSASGATTFTTLKYGELTGLTLSNTNILKITGTSSGVGSGSGDIIGRMGFVEYMPAA